MAETTPITQRLRDFLDGLIVLKEDRTTYIRSANVLVNYDTLCELHGAVESQFGALDSGNEKSSEQLDAERLLDNCFLLISLLFLTIGRNLDPPATYAPSVVIKRLLVHLTESSNFSNKDISPVHDTLRGFKEAIQNNGSTHDLRVNVLMAAKVEECEAVLQDLQDKLNLISPTLYGVHERLVSLRRCIKAAEAKKKFSESEIKGYLDQIQQIDATKIAGKFVGDDGAVPEKGQKQVQLVMDRCYAMAEEALSRQGVIAPGLLHYSDTLHKVKHKLEKFELTQAWSLRETDLYEFMIKLMQYDDGRVDGKFVAEDGSSPEEGQSIILYLLRRSYAHIYTLLISSEPVSEALTPIFNQLQTVQRCLKEVQKFGIADPRDLYPYSMKLSSIENMKVDGKFMVGNDIPEGQGRVASLLAECFEICQELRMNAPDKSPAR
ncbi:hypothetical protein BZA05DRAFT_335573 [Tricharina praecox]|uniref:uncharacterized protein n=1 Tax=Tricharina praecox TaxID=43433 RepID=UPI00221F83F9|nr:uncharacterized protein BZA05DRAFT_335573 [Tricharina praecox]KAI5854409.1 hypothetical protein BZA05DRAFT_335573 [Tricharina praecox]